MTEAEWKACTDPQPMLEFLRGKASDRKRRLFAVASARSIWDWYADERSKNAVLAAEHFADGQMTSGGLAAAYLAAAAAHDDPTIAAHRVEGSSVAAAFAACEVASPEGSELVYFTAACVLDPNPEGFFRDVQASHGPVYKEQAKHLRCIIGNPFHPVAIDTQHRTATVTALAEAIYTDRTFERLPILADALEDAGCTDLAILAHCRGPGPHFRGCWVVDLLLGKA